MSPSKLFLWGGIFAGLATALSFWLIYKHFRNYTMPLLQLYIIRILFMVPIYAIGSWLSLRYKDESVYFDLFRDCYEAYVLYIFFKLLVAFLIYSKTSSERLNVNTAGIDDEADYEKVIAIMEAKPPSHYPFPLCKVSMTSDRKLWMSCRRCILQFVLVKPTLAIVAVALNVKGYYSEGNLTPTRGYLYVMLLDNISITICMYYLVLFYELLKEELSEFNPLSKFMCIKTIIMFAFWQGVIIAILGHLDKLPAIVGWTPEQVATGLQEFIICIEMFLIAIAHMYAFGYKSYRSNDWSCTDFIPCWDCCCFCCRCCSCCSKLTDALSPRDIVKDSVHVFGPSSWSDDKLKSSSKDGYQQVLRDA
eukprot:TRINITY_DN2857_c0_g1_i1.p1 TRINITY_DN2857_c0_g1~~TRINITY_DN2857_c0_g1_i1.p1  ORF type:complete len:400 (-),score=60.73 TRINITY_DN2857_c0_g1_i1:107-1195(-)